MIGDLTRKAVLTSRPAKRHGINAAGPVRYRNFEGRIWKPTFQRLKLPAVGLHVLRHSAAARMIALGAKPKEVQTVLGHRSAAFTLTVYRHVFDTDLDALADRLDDAEAL